MSLTLLEFLILFKRRLNKFLLKYKPSSFYRREQKKLKNQTYHQQRQARKRAQDLLQQQQQLQARRAQLGNQYSQNMDPKRSGTPIIRNGKIVGYAVQGSDFVS